MCLPGCFMNDNACLLVAPVTETRVIVSGMVPRLEMPVEAVCALTMAERVALGLLSETKRLAVLMQYGRAPVVHAVPVLCRMPLLPVMRRMLVDRRRIAGCRRIVLVCERYAAQNNGNRY